MLGYVVFAGCGYECVALASRRRLPTITRIVHRYRDEPAVTMVVVAGLLYLGWHLLYEAAELVVEVVTE